MYRTIHITIPSPSNSDKDVYLYIYIFVYLYVYILYQVLYISIVYVDYVHIISAFSP